MEWAPITSDLQPQFKERVLITNYNIESLRSFENWPNKALSQWANKVIRMKASAFSTMVIVFTWFAGTSNNATHRTDADRPSSN